MTTAVVLSKQAATTLTARIRKAGEDFGSLLLEAHEGRAWEPLGYATWQDYIAGEFAFTRSQSYRLLAVARVERATGEVVPERLAERVVQDVAHARHAPDFTNAPSEAYQAALAEQRAQDYERRAAPKPTSRHAPVRGLEGLIVSVRSLDERLAAVAGERTAEDALPPDLGRVLQRLASTIEGLLR